MNMFLKILSKLGYKAVINTQIEVYNKFKKQYPEVSENDLLNLLIVSRTVTPVRLPGVSFLEEKTHYQPILDNPNKTLEHVIWAIAKYEYFESEYAHARIQKHKMPDWFLGEMKQKIQDYIKKMIKKV